MEVLWEQSLSDTTLINTAVTRTQDTLLKVNEVGASAWFWNKTFFFFFTMNLYLEL